MAACTLLIRIPVIVCSRLFAYLASPVTVALTSKPHDAIVSFGHDYQKGNQKIHIGHNLSKRGREAACEHQFELNITSLTLSW